MKSTNISVTQASRNFADCINRVHYQHVTYVLLKNGRPYAKLIPENSRQCNGKKLAEILSEYLPTAIEAKAWNRDIRAARKTLKPQVEKWR